LFFQGIKTIKAMSDRMKEDGVARAIVVLQAGLTPSAKQVFI
jgi:hypothetical protein